MPNHVEEAEAILGRGPQPPPDAPEPATAREHLKQARLHLRRAESAFRTMYEQKSVPTGIAGADGNQALLLSERVDGLLASIDEHYPESALDGAKT